MEENVEFETIRPQRPVFLKVLCILTFIGSGYGMISNTISYFNATEMSKIAAEAMQEVDKKKDKDPESVNLLNKIKDNASVMATPENIRKAAMGNIITSAFCLLGAVLMWNLRRTGFYIYTLATVISIILPFYLFGSNFLTNLSGGILGFIGILFIIFYAMNIKSMK